MRIKNKRTGCIHHGRMFGDQAVDLDCHGVVSDPHDYEPGHGEITCKRCRKMAGLPVQPSKPREIPTEEGKTGFYCERCLKDANIGHYFDEVGNCVVCGKENARGHEVSEEDNEQAYALGKDENGWYWRYVLPGFNAAETDCVCPKCGFNHFQRKNPASMDEGHPTYSCNCCGYIIHTAPDSEISHIYTDKWAKDPADVGKWIEENKILVRPGETYNIKNIQLRLVTDGKTCFFVDEKRHEVVGKMLTIWTAKRSSVAGVSKRVLEYMLGIKIDSECEWNVR